MTQSPESMRKKKKISWFNHKLIYSNQNKEVKEGSPHDSKEKVRKKILTVQKGSQENMQDGSSPKEMYG